MKKYQIQLCLARTGEEEMKYIQQAFKTKWVAPLGPNVDLLESMLEHSLGNNNHVLCLSSGTAAIHLALVMLGVKQGDEVICSSFTFAASANPIVYQGATPIFVDSEHDSWNMSPELLEHAIKSRIQVTGRKPKAIILVQLFGMPAMMDELLEIAQRYEIPIIEDSAEAQGSKYDGQPCGTFGEYGIFSFNGNKMITTGGGGALICHSENAKKRAWFYATQAREPVRYYQHEQIGYNYRMSNISAGIGCGQMSRLNIHLAHHLYVAKRYTELLQDIDDISIHLSPSEKQQSNNWLTTATLRPKISGIDAFELNERLIALGIESRLLWKPLHMQPVFRDAPAYTNGVSESLFRSGICLPSGPWVEEEQLRQITDEIKNIYR
jgi:dTDP-4-amino-4,6-dideoxygalactose transaminase